VKIPRGPAAVSEDEERLMPLILMIGKAVLRMNRKPEDLPDWMTRYNLLGTERRKKDLKTAGLLNSFWSFAGFFCFWLSRFLKLER